MQELMPIVNETITTVGVALVSLLAAYAMYWIKVAATKLRAQTQAIASDQHRQLVDEAISRVNDLATKTVTQMEQTTAASLRELIKNGGANKEELKRLGKQAVDEIVLALGDDYCEAIAETLGDVRQYVTKAVETKVYELKQAAPVMLALPAASAGI